jgi:hypothetical protein
VAHDVMVIPEGGRDKWVPPSWHAPPPAAESAASTRAGSGRTSTPRTANRARAVDADRPVILGFAIAPASTGVVAILLTFVRPLSGPGSVPYGLLLLCALQVVGLVATRKSDVAILSKSWSIILATTAGLLPLVTLQGSLLREPYVSLKWHSATPAIIATFVVGLCVVVLAGWCVIELSSAPEASSLAIAPPALLVLGILGVHGTIGQQTALQWIAESSLFAAGAMVLAWSLPRGTRLLVTPVALAIQVSVLWAAGRGPTFPATSGGIVTVLYWVTVLVTAATVVLVPVAAASLGRAIERIEQEQRPRRHQSGEGDRLG